MGFDRKQWEKDSQWEERCTRFTIRFSPGDIIASALYDMHTKTGTPETSYIKQAIADKLVSEGYLSAGEIPVIRGPRRPIPERRPKAEEPDYRDPLD